jgi:hypothetical protein
MPLAIEALRKPNYKEEDPGNSCLICGKAIKDPDNATWVQFDNAACEVVTDKEAADRQEVGAQPIGPKCAIKHKSALAIIIGGVSGHWAKSDEQTGTRYYLSGTPFTILKPLGAHRRSVGISATKKYIVYQGTVRKMTCRGLQNAKNYAEQSAFPIVDD